MEKSELRAAVKYFCLKGLTAKEIKAKLDSVDSTSAPKFATVDN